MRALSRWSALLLTLALITTVAALDRAADAQDKKEEKKKEAKKDEKKKKEAKKKVEAKKDEKKEEKKVELKEEKKEPFVPDPAQVELKGHTGWINAIDYSDDGKTIASASRDRSVKVWDIAAKKELQTFKGIPSNVKGLAYEAGRIFGSTGKFNKEKKAWEGEIKVWDAKSGKEAKSLTGHNEEIECLTVSRDGKYLASGSDDQTAKIWDLSAGKEKQTLKGHTGAVTGVAFSADGKLFATASADGSVKLWEPLAGKELATFKVKETTKKTKDAKGKETTVTERGRPFSTVVFSPDGKRLAAGTLDGLIKIYDVDGKKELKEMATPHEGVWALAFSPDGTRLASGGWDQTIKVWDLASGKDVQTIKAHLGTVTAVAFHPSSPQLASASIDGLIKIWGLK